MDYGKHHHSGLDDAKALKKVDAVSHGEGCQNIDDKNNLMENLRSTLCLSFLRSQGASQLVRLMAAVMTRRRIQHESHTCSETSLRILMWNASYVQKHSS